MDDNTNVKIISWLSAGAVALIALFSFAISYVAQRELAVAAGIHPSLTFVFPLVIDGFIIVASLSVLLNSLTGESSKYQWAMVGLFTLLSIAFNAAHAYNMLLNITILGLPVTLIPHVAMPVALFFGFEMLMRQVQSAIERTGMIKSLANLRVECEQKRTELDSQQAELDKLSEQAIQIESEIAKKTAKLTEFGLDLAELQKARPTAKQHHSSAYVRKFSLGESDALDKANRTRSITMKKRRQEVREMFLAGWTVGKLANHFGVDVKTIQRDAAALDIRLVGRGKTARMDISTMAIMATSDNGTGKLDKQGTAG